MDSLAESEIASLVAVVMSFIALIKSLYDSYNVRKSKQEDAENARNSAKDKLEYDSKLIILQNDLDHTRHLLNMSQEAHKESKMERDEIKKELTDCRQQHTEQRIINHDLLAKNSELENRIHSLESKISNHD